MRSVAIRPAEPGDLSHVLALLEEASLLTAGAEEHFADFLVAEAGGRVVGSAGLEFYGNAALLRSVAVAPPLRGQGLGVRLVHRALAAARRRGARRVWLLTDTAGPFFHRLGFQASTREDLDRRLLASGLFTDPTCIDALVMMMDFQTAGREPQKTRSEEARS